ncbi:hypothetical protein C8Q79DRAFT_923738 [Trametes meyenii]|nr:hypothetical protein C8Q79DRAFT_923738 [Trametes meyenii]
MQSPVYFTPTPPDVEETTCGSEEPRSGDVDMANRADGEERDERTPRKGKNQREDGHAESDESRQSTPTPVPKMRGKGKAPIRPATLPRRSERKQRQAMTPVVPTQGNRTLRGPGIPGESADRSGTSKVLVPSTPSPPPPDEVRGTKRIRISSPSEAETAAPALVLASSREHRLAKTWGVLDKGPGTVTVSDEYANLVRPHIPPGAPDLVCTRGGRVFSKELFDDLVLLTVSAILEAKSPADSLYQVTREQAEASIRAAVSQARGDAQGAAGAGPNLPPPYATGEKGETDSVRGSVLGAAVPGARNEADRPWREAHAALGKKATAPVLEEATRPPARRSAMRSSRLADGGKLTEAKTVKFAPGEVVYRIEADTRREAPAQENLSPEWGRAYQPSQEVAQFVDEDADGSTDEEDGVHPKVAIAYTAEPYGGFPPRWQKGPDDLMRGIPQGEIDAFLKAEKDTRIVLQIAGQPLLDEHIAGVLVGRMRDVIAALTGQTQGILVYAPLPTKWQGEDDDYPTAFLVRGLKPEAKAILETQPVWPTGPITLLVDEYEGRSPPRRGGQQHCTGSKDAAPISRKARRTGGHYQKGR